MRTRPHLVFPALLALLALSCSEQQIQLEWDTWVADHAACEAPSDCELVYPGCPLGCFDAVNSEYVGEASALADRLVAQWSGGVRNCAYDCIGATADCVDNVCAAVPNEDF